MATNNAINSSNPIQVAKGGTGVASTTAYAVLCGGTTSTGALQSIASVGSSGDVLTSNGAGALPTFQTPSGGISFVSVTLTNSQIKALHATPIQIIAAPGAGKFISIIKAFGQLNYGGNNAFTNTGSGQINLYYNNGSGQITNAIMSSSAITATATSITYQAQSSILSVASTGLANQAIVAYQTSATEISGNAANDNTITIYVYYTTVTL